MGRPCSVRPVLVGPRVLWVATLGMLSLSTSGICTFRGSSNHVSIGWGSHVLIGYTVANHVFVSCGIHVFLFGSSILVFVDCGISIN